MSFHSYSRIPIRKKTSQRFLEGTCPQLLTDLFKELENAEEIFIASYLFNNPIYFNFLQRKASEGCKIKIFSIPLSGYKTKKHNVLSIESKMSGYDFASEVYDQILKTKNIELYIFPHRYIWYGALYAGGGASYSFHVKAIHCKSVKSTKSILLSGNFMVTDPLHSESMLIAENELEIDKAFNHFFSDLLQLAIPYDQYLQHHNSAEDDFLFTLKGREKNLTPSNYQNCFFTAPFYFYGEKGSNHFAGERISEIISTAKKRIWVCAQHFHDLLSFDTNRQTIINGIYQKYMDDKSIEFKFLKQVPHSSLADKRRAGIAETFFQFEMKAEQRYNRLVHDKFIIVDDTLIFSTANYTSTQFAFGERKMDYKLDSKKISKQDYFSEVNGFMIVENNQGTIIKDFDEHFNLLWESGEEISIKI